MSVGVGELLVESDGLADGEAVGDLVGLTDLVGFGLLRGRAVLDGSTWATLWLGVGLGNELLGLGSGVTGGVLMCCAVLLRTSPVFGLDLWPVR